MYMLGRKKDLEHRMFSDRRDLSAQYRQKNVGTVTIPEIIEFLKLSARSHKRIYKYTKLSRVEEMISSKYLCLSRLTEMNDLQEYKNVKKNLIVHISLVFLLVNMKIWQCGKCMEERSVSPCESLFHVKMSCVVLRRIR